MEDVTPTRHSRLREMESTMKNRHRTEEKRLKKLFKCLLFVTLFAVASATNSPPRFVLDDGDDIGGNIVVRLREGPATPPGTRILRLRGFDPDGDELTFGVSGSNAQDLLRVENKPNSDEASVYLNRVLDHETQSEFAAVVTLTDGKLGDGNYVKRSFLLLVEDINDNAPVFRPHPQAVSVQEHSGEQVVTVLEATDRDSGIFGQVVYSLEPADGDFQDFPFAIRADKSGKGVVTAVDDLDFERKPVYEVKVIASDRAPLGGVANSAATTILVKVEDVSDTPPQFVSAPSVTRIPEDVPRFTEVGIDY